MRKVVPDTNLIVSALIVPGSSPERALLRLQERKRIAVSLGMLAEWRDVLNRPKFARYLSPERVEDFLIAIAEEAELVLPTVMVRDCRDEKDDKVLECALEARADLIVSGEEDLLVLHPWRGIPILSPVDYLAS